MNNDLMTTFASPLSDAAPCGENLEYDARMIELDEQYAGEPEHMMGDSVIPATPPDWRKLEKAAAGLMKETRDLRIAVIWTVARLANGGLSGLRDGLELIDALSEQMWERLWPIPDDGDVQERLSTLMRLSPMPGSFDADTTVLRLLLATPLTASPALGSYSLDDIRQAAEGSDADRTIRAALRDTPAEKIREQLEHLDAILGLLHHIRDVYTEHAMGTPDFRMLTDRLKEMQLFLLSAAPASEAPAPDATATDTASAAAGSPAGAATSAAATASAPAGGAGLPGSSAASGANGPGSAASPASVAGAQPTAGAAGAAANLGALPVLPVGCDARSGREQAVRLMEQLCAWFEENEPSSPVPYFLRRAIRSVGANFMELMTDIAPQSRDQLQTVLKPGSSAGVSSSSGTPSGVAPGSAQAQAAAPLPTAPAPAPEPPAEAAEFFSPFG